MLFQYTTHHLYFQILWFAMTLLFFLSLNKTTIVTGRQKTFSISESIGHDC